MAADLGELLVPYMPTIKVPKTGDRVYKDECVFSFDSPESEGGLYVCMNTFLGFGREHVERHYRKTGQSVYMHLKRTIKEVRVATEIPLFALLNPYISGLQQESPSLKNDSSLANLELNCDFNCDDYEYEDEAKLVIFPDHFEIPLPNIEELPALVSECVPMLSLYFLFHSLSPILALSTLGFFRKSAAVPDFWRNSISPPPTHISLLSGWKCAKCEMRENLWLNLTDGSVLCGKWFFDGSGGNGHALEHYRETNFPLAVRLGTITPDGADVYSFDEEEAVLDPHIAEHLAHFGIDMLQMQKNGHVDNEVRPRVTEWEVIQESGLKLKAVYGSGYTGIRNLGNSCYLGTTMQVLFSIPEFQRAYVGNLQRIFDYSPLDPSQDFSTQIGISPRMFKALVSKGHPEFSSNRQQDAQEFFLHIINLVERNSAGAENPSDVFRFLVEERIQCCQSRKVRYTQRVDYLMQLPTPIEAATNREELIAYEAKRQEAEENLRTSPEPVRAKIPFTACVQAFTEPENVPDFWSSALQAKSAGIKTSRFASFPEYLVVQIKKFTFGVDWVPKKLDVSIDMPDFLDLSRLRATGLQAGEEELPDLTPPIVLPEDTRAPEIDESAVMQLAEMGFPLEACRKAVYYTGNMGAEMAFNWIIAHMEEPDFAEPLAVPSYSEPGPSSPSQGPSMDSQPPEDSVAILTSMGFSRAQTIRALKATNSNLERALDWIFTHPDSEEESEFPLVPDCCFTGYELFAFISHMGTSTMSGHYVCHIKKEGRWVIYNDHKVCLSERPPKDLGYIYFYHRLSCS
uniref:Ubiquitin carboxyl-terminal hydrolase n=1 Tax=Scleropages formosus TaxID=113540 RepID=A0A8C9SSY9_SCLFO